MFDLVQGITLERALFCESGKIFLLQSASCAAKVGRFGVKLFDVIWILSENRVSAIQENCEIITPPSVQLNNITSC